MRSLQAKVQAVVLTSCSVIKWLFRAIKLPLVSCDAGPFNVNRLFCFWLSWINKNESGDGKIIPPQWHSMEAASWQRQWVKRTFAVVGLWCFYGSCIRERVCVCLLLHRGRHPNRQVETRSSSPGFYYLQMTFLLFLFYTENLFKLKIFPPKHNSNCIIGAQVYLQSSLKRQWRVQERHDAIFEGKTTYVITH